MALLDEISADPLDVLVIGGGIVGAGIARDAAMRGLRTALFEQRDFASGTSSRSSRLLHGGLRYLAQGRLGLVREASIEKGVLHRIAPHLAIPLPFLFPTYRGTKWPLWKLRLGVEIYDRLCGRGRLGRSSRLAAAQLRTLVPQIATQGLTGAVRYFDGFTSDARLVLDTLRSARRHGAALLNYAPVLAVETSRHGWRCRMLDEPSQGEYFPEARCVVNATGPWAPGFEPSRMRLRLTKGVHLIVARDRLPLPEAVVLSEKRRILFAIPWGQRVILGTTDTDYEGRIEDVRTEPEDVSYILAVLERYFPAAGVGADDVIASWAGLRPLVARGRGRPSEISRSHHISMTRAGWIDVGGGKLTTYRLMAEQVLARVLRHLGRKGPPCRTASEPLLDAQPAGGPSGIIPPEQDRAVIAHYCREEWARHLEDVMIRRSGWDAYLDDPGASAAQVASWMGEELGWSEERREGELRDYLALRAMNSPIRR